MRLCHIAAAFLLALAPPAWAKDWKQVTIATEGAYPPYNMHGPDGKLIGFEIDLAADLCGRIKVTCTFVPQDWDGIIPGLNAGKFDAIMSGMSITAKRREVIDFSLPYSNSPTTFAATKGGGLDDLPLTDHRVSLNDDAATKEAVAALTPRLKGKAVAVQVSTIQADVLTTYFKGVVDVRTYKTTEEMALDLAAGRVDAMLASQASVQAFLDGADGKDSALTGPLLTGGVLGLGTGVGLRKSDGDLKAMFDGAVKAASDDGTIRTLSLKWFKVDLTPR